jgi:hypothetical protein
MGFWKCYLDILTEKYAVGCWVREKIGFGFVSVNVSFWLNVMYPHIRPYQLLAHWLTCVSTHSTSHTPTLLTYLPHSEIACRQILASRQVQMCLACSHWRVLRPLLPKRSLSMLIVCRSKWGCLDEANGKQHDQMETSVRYGEHSIARFVKNIIVFGIPSYRTSILYAFGNSDREFVQYEYWSRAR